MIDELGKSRNIKIRDLLNTSFPRHSDLAKFLIDEYPQLWNRYEGIRDMVELINYLIPHFSDIDELEQIVKNYIFMDGKKKKFIGTISLSDNLAFGFTSTACLVILFAFAKMFRLDAHSGVFAGIIAGGISGIIGGWSFINRYSPEIIERAIITVLFSGLSGVFWGVCLYAFIVQSFTPLYYLLIFMCIFLIASFISVQSVVKRGEFLGIKIVRQYGVITTRDLIKIIMVFPVFYWLLLILFVPNFGLRDTLTLISVIILTLLFYWKIDNIKIMDKKIMAYHSLAKLTGNPGPIGFAVVVFLSMAISTFIQIFIYFLFSKLIK